MTNRRRYIKSCTIILTILALCLTASVVLGAKLYPPSVKDVFTLSVWLRDYTYQDDPHEYWKEPYETIRDKGGDCEDSTLLVRYVLDDLGYANESSVAVVFEDRTGHAFNILKDEKGFTMFSNFVYFDYHFDSMLEVIDFWYPDWVTLYYITYDNKLRYIGKNDKNKQSVLKRIKNLVFFNTHEVTF